MEPPQKHNVPSHLFRKESAKWVDKAEKGDIVIIWHYHRPVAQLISYQPLRIVGEGETAAPEGPPLSPVYYAADRKFPDTARIIAGVLSRVDASTASRIATMALVMESEAEKKRQSPPPPESRFVAPFKQKLISAEEMEALAQESRLLEASQMSEPPPKAIAMFQNGIEKKKP